MKAQNDESRPPTKESGPEDNPNSTQSIEETPPKQKHSRWDDSQWRRAYRFHNRVTFQEAAAVAAVDRRS